MTRRIVAFDCAGETLVGTLDAAAGTTGVLIVSGGNEIRSGAHRGMARLAARLAAAGIPVFRFDRRGVGDSSGENCGYAQSGPDIAAAVAAFRRFAPDLVEIVGFGNCDAATALALFGAEAGIAPLVLANPWVVEEDDDLPPAAAIRARYLERVLDPATWLRLVKGGVDLRKLFRGLAKVVASPSQENALAARVVAGVRDGTVLLARRDATAVAFAAATTRAGVRVCELDSASHSFAGARDRAWLLERVVEAVRASG